jgi:hypothetical protein
MFSEVEKALLRELAMNPTWGSVLTKLREFHRLPPRYKPGERESRAQELDWIYWSGVDQARTDLLKLLGDE